MAKKANDNANMPVSQAESGEIGEKNNEPMYKMSEFVNASNRIFGVSSDCVEAALKLAGKTEYTISEAKGIVDKFMKKEVK